MKKLLIFLVLFFNSNIVNAQCDFIIDIGDKKTKIVEMFAEEEVPVQFACMGFRDYKADPRTAFEMTDFQENPVRLVHWLNKVRSFGGGSNFGD